MTSAATFLPAKFSREISGDFHTSRNFGADAAAETASATTTAAAGEWRTMTFFSSGRQVHRLSPSDQHVVHRLVHLGQRRRALLAGAPQRLEHLTVRFREAEVGAAPHQRPVQ